MARGRCTKCGAWVCASCTHMHKGQFFCTDTCGPHTASSGPAVAPPAATPVPPLHSMPATQVWHAASTQKAIATQNAPAARQPLILWGALLLATGGLFFGLWNMRENNALHHEVIQLKEKRLELLNYIHDARRESTLLKHDLDSLTVDDTLPFIKRKAPAGRSLLSSNPAEPGINNLPLSFNNGSAAKKMVAITFDGGSYANAVDNILDTLRSRGVHTTMFLTGEFIRKHPAAVVALAQNGHELGNHTDTHLHLTSYAQDNTQTTLPGVTRERIAAELNRADQRLFELAGVHFSPLWRAPYGEFNRTICRYAQEAGYLHIGWTQGNSWRTNLDSNDWIPEGEAQSGFKSPDQVLEKIMTAARREGEGINGGIILMHLGTERKDPANQVHRILGRLIDELRGAGYEVVTVGRLLEASGVDVTLLPGRSNE